MLNLYSNEPMMEIYIFETSQLVEQLEQIIISNEKADGFTSGAINEIFRIMHTIKGSSAMMMFNNISTLAHAVEDLFYLLREGKAQEFDKTVLSDLILECVDFIKIELEKIKNGDTADGDAAFMVDNLKSFLALIKKDAPEEAKAKESAAPAPKFYISSSKPPVSSKRNSYKAVIFFEDGCEMENIRAFTVVHSLRDITEEYYHIPENLVDDDEGIQVIREKGFTIFFKIDKEYDEMYAFFNQTIFLKSLELVEVEEEEFKQPEKEKTLIIEQSPVKVPKLEDISISTPAEKEIPASSHQSIISVGVGKLDKLMDLVGELVISEAMVTQNPDLRGLELDNFQKAARHLKKITSELQDMVMSIRMVPIAPTFHKMNRIVRDMSKKLNKDIRLEIKGEETEVDKNIIEHISDPLMHLVRNAIDHGIESDEERRAKGKTEAGSVTLEAKSAGSDVLVLVRDNGKGLNKEKILKRARDNGLLTKPESEMTDKEIYNLIFLPGFSTKENVTEFSGRGVGMDVVTKSIEAIGGSVLIDSILDAGTTITLKIPLTLAIIDGMNISVGSSRYTLPMTAIKESFRPKEDEIFSDPDGNEMIMVRGQCYPIMRLHEIFNVKTDITRIHEGIILMVETEERTICLFADELLGEQQVVVKALPNYIKNTRKIKGLAGCTLLGDGSISLILDLTGLLGMI